MADSPRPRRPRKKSPPTPAQSEKNRERVKALKASRGEKGTPLHEKTEVSELPRWVRMALAEYETGDLKLSEIARKYDKAKSTLESYSYCPAGRKWREEVKKYADDPERISMAVIRASAMNVTLDYLMALQSAIEAGDYREIGVMSRDILDRLGMTKQPAKTSQTAPKAQLIINLGPGATLDAPMVKSALQIPKEIIEDADFEVIDGDE